VQASALNAGAGGQVGDNSTSVAGLALAVLNPDGSVTPVP
jgi:hypothetical protein